MTSEQKGVDVLVPWESIDEAIRHMTNWLDLNDCECESGHQCGRIEVQRTRDQLRALTTPIEQEG